MYVCMYVWMDGWMDGCMGACMYACVYSSVCVRACVCVYVCMYVCMYVFPWFRSKRVNLDAAVTKAVEVEESLGVYPSYKQAHVMWNYCDRQVTSKPFTNISEQIRLHLESNPRGRGFRSASLSQLS